MILPPDRYAASQGLRTLSRAYTSVHAVTNGILARCYAHAMVTYYTSQEVAEAVADLWGWAVARGAPGVWIQPNMTNPALPPEVWLVEWNAPYELRELSMEWTRNPTSTDVQDRAVCTFHFLNMTAGAPDPTWTDADYTAVEAAIDTYWTNIKTNFVPDTVLIEYRWRADGPAFKPFGGALQPTLRRTPRNVPGTEGTGKPLPPQVAITVTERTSAEFTVPDVGDPPRAQLRKRWGRIYLPAASTVVVDDGRIGAAYRTAFAGHLATAYNALRGQELFPVMYSPTTGKAWTVDAVACDDVFDVIRSRRFRTVLARTVSTTTA